MRIGVSGLSSTGKTTLARQISMVLQLPLLDEGMKHVYARRREKIGRDIPKWSELSIGSKIDFQMEMIQHRCEKEMNLKEFVGDGTPLDIMAFWLEWSTRDPGDSAYKYSNVAAMDELLGKALARYDIIFQLPFGVLPVEDDNRRITDVRFLSKINHLLMSITTSQLMIGGDCPVIHKVKSISLPDRIDEVVMAVHDLRAPA